LHGGRRLELLGSAALNARLPLLVFAKPPRAGVAKTRLAAALGADGAAELARALFADTWSTATSCAWARPILVTPEPEAAEWRDLGVRERWAQGGGDLGARMARAVRRALAAGAPAAIVVGSDAPGLTIEHLAAARNALAAADAVLGPCRDGGYYLLGLKRCPSDLLDGLPWSSPATLVCTERRLLERGLRVERLSEAFDVDRVEDLEPLRRALAAGEVAAPATARALATLAPTPPRISVVMPVVDEAARIERQLRTLAGAGGWHEIVVVDGGSRDRTAEIAAGIDGVRVIESPRGRGAQMNRGARAASGDVLLFLHADVELPADAGERIAAALADPTVVAGAFRTWTVDEGRSRRLAPWLHLGDLRSRYSRLPYGDQALFVRAAVFRRVGGYPEQPLMEDLELSRRLRRAGRIRIVRARVRVSGRRFLARPVYYFLLVNLLPLFYAAGVPPARLARLYADPR
jgi:uncharacterized protein